MKLASTTIHVPTAGRWMGECAWTLRVDNTFGQPGTKA